MANQGQQRSILGWDQQERGRDNARCPRCGGMLYLEKLPDDGPRRKFSEWTCLICGSDLLPPQKRGKREEREETAGDRKPMDNLTPPIPYYGGKRRWVKPIWDRLGNPDIYLEPCGGDLAVLLGRPHNPRLEVVCDTSGLVSNFWRAIRQDPEGVALEADYPTIHQDLTARQRWLMEWAVENAERLPKTPNTSIPKLPDGGAGEHPVGSGRDGA